MTPTATLTLQLEEVPTSLQQEEIPTALQLEEVPTASVTLQLEIPKASMASKCSSPTVRVESTVEAARIHHLEVPTASATLQLQVPTTSAM
jgi:hypothetical protein